MSNISNDLHDIFPEHADKIAELKGQDAHFARLIARYQEVDRAIHRAETNIEPTDDFHEEDMRKERLRLLDDIGAMLRAD